MLISLNFSSLNKPFLFSTNTFKEGLCGFIIRILGNEFSLNSFLQNRFFQKVREYCV